MNRPQLASPSLLYDKTGERWFVYGEDVKRVATCSRSPEGRFRVSIEDDAETLSRQELRLLVDALQSLLTAEPEPHR